MTVRLLKGDCRDVLRTLPDESVHCVVTSPPYWSLRDYGVAGQIGLEASFAEYVTILVDVFREVRRVLRADGTLWLNLGDTYAQDGGPGWQGKNGQRADRRFTAVRDTVPMRECARSTPPGLKPKDLVGIPWRVAFALQDDGWWLRQDIIWAKPNPMPESVRDRCTKAHEYVFLLAKSERYWFDQAAILEPTTLGNEARWAGDEPGLHSGEAHKGATRRFRKSGNKTHKHVAEYEASESEEHRTKAGLLAISDKAYPLRNKRSVWTVGSEPFPEAHFATFPPALIEPCILAGCPVGGTVLDPFGGAGTTGLVADRFGRDAILIELNPDYAAIAERRIRGDAPLFAEVS
jgi:DNA modification methylase